MDKKAILEKVKEFLKLAKANPEQFRELTKTVPTAKKTLRHVLRSQEMKRRGLPKYKLNPGGDSIGPDNPHAGHRYGINRPWKDKKGSGESVMGHKVRNPGQWMSSAKEDSKDRIADMRGASKPNLPKSEEIQDDIQKTLKIAGTHIGQTKSGKAIGSDLKSQYSLGFNSQDHKDAYNAHFNAAQATSNPKLKAHHMNMTKFHMQASQRSEGPIHKPSSAPHTMLNIHKKSEQEPNLIHDKEIRMDTKEVLEMAKQLLKAAKENPAEFGEAIKKAMAAPAPAPAAAPKAPAAPKMAAPKAPAVKAPAMQKCGQMSKQEQTAMIKEELKADFKPKFRK
jgi:hypothetical protein